MQSNSKEFQPGLNAVVFYGSAVIASLIVFFSLFWPNVASQTFNAVQKGITDFGSWYYILMGGFIFLICIYLALSRYGDIKLGPDHAKPEYSRPTWFAMLFSAGLGIALVFYGVAEPVMHFLNPPVMEGGTREAAKEALNITIFHWGFHAWAIYVIIALILSVYCYRHGLPLMVRSVLYPLIGERIYGRIGDVVDIFAICGTLFGVATSMGFGAIQINAGINHLVPAIPASLTVQSVLIMLVTLLATLSVVSGLNKGIKILSNINMTIAVILMLFVLFAGNTVPVMNMFVQNLGEYFNSLMGKTFNLYAYEETSWIGGWTVFYWAWWFAWCPFVGMFIARISRGRTIREFVLGVLLVPTCFVALWMSIFGNNAISLILDSGLTQLGQQVTNDVSVALFVFLEQLPFSTLTQSIAVCLIVIFFVTSADSGSLVINILSCNGADNPPNWMRVFWTSTIGVVAFVLLYAGGLSALQTMTIVSALPVSIILMFAIYGLFKVLIVDYHKQEAFSFTAYLPQGHAPNWRTQLQNMTTFPNAKEAEGYLNGTVTSALNMVVEEINAYSADRELQASVEGRDGFARIVIRNGSDYDFRYEVHLVEHATPVAMEGTSASTYYRAEVHLAEGGKGYSIMGWSQDSVIADVLSQFQKHMHFLHNISEAGHRAHTSHAGRQATVAAVSDDIKTRILEQGKPVVNM
ncbi:BCCT family transporter [Oceanimonas sp. MB9]|uniref:BCCT family transporter n=1 Tax=Oceanimonas sp. MB9 TaxID=2588453 RepID=UPI0013F61F7D|nr:BCCT family transporter [Oceanimonas sp. MB9]NHI00274.1 Glycine betaine/proline betaine transporter BetS [Oceanimonas sp. MB9]